MNLNNVVLGLLGKVPWYYSQPITQESGVRGHSIKKRFAPGVGFGSVLRGVADLFDPSDDEWQPDIPYVILRRGQPDLDRIAPVAPVPQVPRPPVLTPVLYENGEPETLRPVPSDPRPDFRPVPANSRPQFRPVPANPRPDLSPSDFNIDESQLKSPSAGFK